MDSAAATASTLPAPPLFTVDCWGVASHWTETFADREKAVTYAARMMLAGFAATLSEGES